MLIQYKKVLVLLALISFQAGALELESNQCDLLSYDEYIRLVGENSKYGQQFFLMRCKLITGDYQYSALSAVRFSELENCVFTEIAVENPLKINEPTIYDKTYFNMVSRRRSDGGCPNHNSGEYIRIDEIHNQHSKDELYQSFISLLDQLKGGENEIKKSLSSISFFKKLFSKPYDKFKTQLVDLGKRKEKGIEIIFLQKNEKGYVASIKIDKLLWVLDLVLDDNGIHIKNISSAIP